MKADHYVLHLQSSQTPWNDQDWMTRLLVFPGALLGGYTEVAFTMGPGGNLPNLPLSAPEKKDIPREFSKKGKLRSPK